MRKLSCLFLTVVFLAAFAMLPRIASAQDQNAQDQNTQNESAQDQNGQNPYAPDQNEQDQNVDPPSRVARLSYTQGSVSYQVSGDSDWVAADPNRPLTTNDNLWVDKDSLGELHIGSTAIRMSSETGISILNLDDRTAQIQLAQGTIEIHLRNLQAGDAWEFDTPNLSFTLMRAGEYRITTDPDDNATVIVVREGEGSVSSNGDSYDLAAGNEYRFVGTDQIAFSTRPQPGWDDFDNWCQSRDQLENNSQSAQYVSRDVDGYYDLDNSGVWSEVPDYGPVWIPNDEPVGWAPYRMGHWVWVAPWGWTWVDDEPWGWAPFHYGRWVIIGAHWGWVPGPRVVRPVYAPALVGFVGGRGWSVSISFGGAAGVAWFPLGPRDVYVPGYHCSERYVQMVNVTNTRVVNVTRVTNVYNTVIINRQENHYTYENNERAVVAVPRDTFVNARPVRTSTIRVNQDQLRNVRVVENAPLAPTRGSYVSATARVSTARPAVPMSQRPVMVKLPPPRAARPPVYTNESAPFNGGNRNQPNEGRNMQMGNRPEGGRNVQPANQPNQGRNTQTPNQPNQGNRDTGFRPFTPPGQNNTGGPPNRPTSTMPPPERVNQPPTGGGNVGGPPNRPTSTMPPPERVNQPPAGGANQAPTPTPGVRTNQQFNRNQDRGNQNPNREYNPPNQNQPTAQPQNQPHVRYEPPVRARDQNYDVHPPLNKAPRTNSAPRNERPSPPPKSDSKPKSDGKPHGHG